MFRRNRKDMAKSETVELRHVGHLLLRIDFVDDNEDGLRRTPQKAGEFLIRSSDAGSAIDNQEKKSRTFDRHFGLFENAHGDLALFARNDAAGVYNFVGTTMPTYSSVNSIARDARLIGH